jgi:outer membrane protein assembly factor BamB
VSLRRGLLIAVALLHPACGSGSGGIAGTPPLGFMLRSPNNGEPLALTRPQFSWDVALGAFSYRIEISTAPDFSLVVDDQSVTTTSWSPSIALAGSTTFWWRVRAVNDQGETFATNNPFSFTTVSTANTWGCQGFDVRHSGYNPSETGIPPLTFAWSAALGTGALNPVVYEAGRVLITPYAVNSGNTFLTALNASTGAPLWAHDFTSIFSIGQPAVSAGRVYLQTSNNSIAPGSNAWSIDAATGSVIWSTPIGSQWEHFWSPIIVANSMYSNGGYYGGLYGRDTTNGAQTFFNSSLEQYAEWSPAYDNGTIYSFIAGNFRAHDPSTGVIQWTRNVTWTWAGYSMYCSPVLDGTRGYVIAPPNLHAINLSTQLVDWSVTGLAFTGTVSQLGNTLFANSGGTLRAHAADSGTFLWSFTGDSALKHQPVIANGYLYVSSDANTYAVRLSDQTQVWTAAVGGWLSIAGGKLFIANPTGVLTAYSLSP